MLFKLPLGLLRSKNEIYITEKKKSSTDFY